MSSANVNPKCNSIQKAIKSHRWKFNLMMKNISLLPRSLLHVEHVRQFSQNGVGRGYFVVVMGLRGCYGGVCGAYWKIATRVHPVNATQTPLLIRDNRGPTPFHDNRLTWLLRDGFYTGAVRYSEGSLLRRFVIPKVWRFVIPKVCYSEGLLFRRFVIPKVCYSEGSLFRTHKFRILGGSLIRKWNRVR